MGKGAASEDASEDVLQGPDSPPPSPMGLQGGGCGIPALRGVRDLPGRGQQVAELNPHFPDWCTLRSGGKLQAGP